MGFSGGGFVSRCTSFSSAMPVREFGGDSPPILSRGSEDMNLFVFNPRLRLAFFSPQFIVNRWFCLFRSTGWRGPLTDETPRDQVYSRLPYWSRTWLRNGRKASLPAYLFLWLVLACKGHENVARIRMQGSYPSSERENSGCSSL